MVNFLERLSGWEQDGLQFHPAMAQSILALAKESALGCMAIAKMVRDIYIDIMTFLCPD